MAVKWHGCRSRRRNLPGGGPAGFTLGLLEYLNQSYDNVDTVSLDNRFKFVDDFTFLEIVNLLTACMSSFDMKSQVPNEITSQNQYISSSNLKSQQHLDNINHWTQKNKMLINQNKNNNNDI